MPTPILATKLYIPPPRSQAVRRPQLLARLQAGLGSRQARGRKLTLISAPAGFGKTTLASQWIAACERPAAWLSLDESDNDPLRFLNYLVAALQTIQSAGGEGVLAMLQSSQPPPVETILTALLNEIAAFPEPFVLVLDDFHVLEAGAVYEMLGFVLEHQPAQMHLLITTREDPQLPLARLRARGELTELREADLRFSRDEAAEFLNRVMGLELEVENIAALEARTEGWIAGLQMAALSMQGQSDTDGFIQAFTGSHRFVLDYLVEEVLQRQPAAVRSFLLQTAILERLCGPLCEAVSGQPGGGDMLQALERSNLFVIPLDDRRAWYRYHHLFADVLQARARAAHPEQIPELHRRASAWYERNDLLAPAVQHALAARDFERAADLIELARPEMDRTYQSAAWLGWAQALPDELVRNRPVLSAAYGWALLDVGELEASEARLQAAERWLVSPAAGSVASRTESGMVVVDEAQFRALPASIATARAYRSLALADIQATVDYARQALEAAPAEVYQWRVAAASLLGLALYTRGELPEAERALVELHGEMLQAGLIEDAISLTFILADIRIALGRPQEAASTYQQSLKLAEQQGEKTSPVMADLYRGISELDLELGDLQAAEQSLTTGERLGRQASLTNWPYRLLVAQAGLQEAQGDLEGALARLEAAERGYIRNPLPDVRPIAALKARLWIRQGDLSSAQAWAQAEGLSSEEKLSYMREFEHLTLARLLIARYERGEDGETIRQAAGLLERLRQAAEAGQRTGSAIAILVLQALAFQAQENTDAARERLGQALSLAEPQGYVQVFAGEGRRLMGLLTSLQAQGFKPGYIGKLLAASGAGTPAGGSGGAPPAGQPLVEPLSERELEVLQLVAQGLSNREIGERLFLAVDTVKGHNRKIFGKLQVQRRTEAVARARQLGLVD